MRHSTAYPASRSAATKLSHSSPALSGMILPSASRGPQLRISVTFSRPMMRGRQSCTHCKATRGRSRTFLARGLPPRAREKWRQSGESQRRSTFGRFLPGKMSHDGIFQTSPWKCRVLGWLAACISTAAGLWFRATVTSCPRAARMPSDAPPPPQNRSTITTVSPPTNQGSPRRGGVQSSEERGPSEKTPHPVTHTPSS